MGWEPIGKREKDKREKIRERAERNSERWVIDKVRKWWTIINCEF